MQVDIRLATRANASALGLLIDAMDVHYRGAGARRDPRHAAEMVRAALNTKEGTRFLVAWQGELPVGIACFAVVRPGRDLRGMIFLKDLFVVEEARGAGIGRRIMQALAEYAIEHQIGRIELTTESTNTGAQRLYEELGAEKPRKVHYRFEGPSLGALARGKREQGKPLTRSLAKESRRRRRGRYRSTRSQFDVVSRG
jgi:GNAT superfamily N-acetyltransferase